MLLFRDKRINLLLPVWPLLASYSRLYLGVHYPLDIVAGTNESLMHAIREAHDRLDKMASSYWYVLGKEEVPL